MCSKCIKALVLSSSDSEISAVEMLGGIDSTKSKRATLKGEGANLKMRSGAMLCTSLAWRRN